MKKDFSIVTNDIVLEYAERLISQRGNTTTLEVKTLLQAEGYWATQENVSARMNELAWGERLRWSDYETDGVRHRREVVPVSEDGLSFTFSSMLNKVKARQGYVEGIRLVEHKWNEYTIFEMAGLYFKSKIDELSAHQVFLKTTVTYE